MYRVKEREREREWETRTRERGREYIKGKEEESGGKTWVR